mgnify:CR=1 FL=1|jgi:translation initiation factor 3 subunit G
MTSVNEPSQYCLPSSSSSGPDENGIKTYIEYKFNDKNQFPPHVKVTRRVKVQTTTKRVKKAVKERKKWVKFGAAKGKNPGEIDRDVTIYSTEDVFIESPYTKQEDIATTLFKKLEADKIKRIVRKNMKSDIDSFADIGNKSDNTINKNSFMGAKTNSYVVPGKKSGINGNSSFGQHIKDRDDSPSLRITNLSEDTLEYDIRDLFSPYGNIMRIHLALDHYTKKCRGFAFVSFYNKEDAQNAMDNLRGKAFNHLIIGVEWAKPSKR